MKCDHIRTRLQGETPFFPNKLNNGKVEVCLKEDVVAAIVELKGKVICAEVDRDYLKLHCEELKAENESLKAKLEDVQATAYADSVDAGMENRRLRRALWLARAEIALKEKNKWHIILYGHNDNREYNIMGEGLQHAYGFATMRTSDCWYKIWQKVEWLCRRKAEA